MFSILMSIKWLNKKRWPLSQSRVSLCIRMVEFKKCTSQKYQNVADVAKPWFNYPVSGEYVCLRSWTCQSIGWHNDFERLLFHFLRESPNLLSYLVFQNKCLVDFFEELFIIWPMQRKEHYSWNFVSMLSSRAGRDFNAGMQ